MKLKLLTLAIGAAVFMPVNTAYAADGYSQPSKHGHDGPKLYGRLDLAISNYDPDVENKDSFFDVESYASRLGVKGKVKTDYNIDVVYKYELELNSFEDENNSSNDSDHLKARDQYVGIKGEYGQLTLGREDTALKRSQGKIDLFGDHRADLKHVITEGEDRTGDTITYKSPDYMGLQGMVTLIAGEKNNSSDFETGGSTGKTDEDYTGIADGTSVAVSYKFDDYYFAIAANSEVEEWDALRFTTTAKFGDFGLGFLYQDAERSHDSQIKEEGYILSGYYKIGAAKFKLQMGSAEDKTNGVKQEERDLLALGYDFKLAKPTTLYAEYTGISTKAPGQTDVDESAITLGLKHKF